MISGFSFWNIYSEKKSDYNKAVKELNEVKNERDSLIVTIEKLKTTPPKLSISKDESASIINGKVLITPTYFFSSSVNLKIEGGDGYSNKKEGNYYSTSGSTSAYLGDQLYIKIGGEIWVINVLKINPFTIDVARIE